MKEEIISIIKEVLDIEVRDGVLDLDSIDFLDVIVRIENVYDIDINIHRFKNETTLDELVQVVEEIRQKKLNS